MNERSNLLLFAAAIVCAVIAVPTSRAEGILVAHYEFEDPDNLGLDSSGFNNHAEVADVEQVEGALDGLFGQGGFFDESLSSSFTKFDGLEGFTGKPGVTLAAWVKLDEATTGFDGIISQDAGACCDNRILLHNGDHRPFINLSEHDDRHLADGPVFEIDEWMHIAMTGLDDPDGGFAVARVYVNGEEIEGSPQEFPEMDDGSAWNTYLGVGESGTAHRLTGTLDDVRVYEGALDDEEILGLLTPAPSLPPFVGIWKFDGDATDSSGNGNDGELVDGAEFSDDTPRGDGGKSLLLEGGAHVLVEHSETLNITDAITIAAWVKPVGEFEWDGVIAKNPSDDSDNNHAGNYELRIENGGRHLHFLHQQGGSNDTAFHQGLASIIDPDVWTHIVVTAETENGNVNFYINGELSETLEEIITIDEFPTNENPLFIGSRADLFTPFDGLLDEVVLHNEVLDETEIENLFTNGLRAPGDADGDGMPDEWEETHGFDPADPADAALDPDGDTLTNLQEFEKRTDPKSDDTDKDGLADNVETNTGVWVSLTDTGTSPTKDDTDKDGLKDGVENPDLPYDPANAATQPGTDPNKRDTDGDLVGDGSEVTGGTDPTDRLSVPSVIRGGGLFTTTHIWTDGDPQLSDVFGVEEAFADPGEAEIITVEHPYIHYHDNANAPIFQDLSEPYPLWGPQGNDEGPGDRNDFAIHSVGNINITQAGDVTFVCNSDDGFDLRIDGDSIGEAGNRGRGNTFMTVNLTAGIHELEFLHWERGGGAGVSVYIFRSTGDAPATLNDGEWQLLEASGGGKAAFEITSVAVEGGNLVFSWPSSPGENFAIEKGSDLQDWEEVTDGHPAGDGESTEFELELGDPAPAVLYVRVRKEG